MSESMEREKNRVGRENIEKNTQKYSFALNKLLQVVEENGDYQNAVNRDKAKYRLMHSVENTETAFDKIDDLRDELYLRGYIVDIIEDFECKDVNKESRYTIKVSKNKVFIETNLLEYKENINDFEFDVLVFWEENINKINGGIVKESVIVAKLVAEYLSYIMYFRYMYTVTYKTMGWEKYVWDKEEWIFKYDKIYSKIPFLKGNIVDEYGDGLTAIKDMDDYGNINIDEDKSRDNEDEENEKTISSECGKAYCINWVINTLRLLNKHDIIALLIGAGVSGVVRSLLPFTKETNININIFGEPASGKSIIGHYILSIFGDPERLEGSFTDTDNAMEQKRVQRPILPYVLDERMLKVQGESKDKKSQTVLMDIFREYEGKVKERLGKQYQEFSGERTYGPIISSSVDSMMELVFKSKDLGQYRRFMEFNVSREDKVQEGTYILFDSAEEAKLVEEMAYKNYGYGIIILVEYILDLLDDLSEQHILDRFNHLDKTVKNILEYEEKENKVIGLTSSSKRFALIILSYQLFREALISYISEVRDSEINKQYLWDNRQDILKSDDLIIDKSEEISNILVDNVMQKFKKVNIYKKLTNNLADYIFKYKNTYFFECDTRDEGWYTEGEEDNTKYLGKWRDTGNAIEICLIKSFHLENLLFKPVIPEPQVILDYIKERQNKGINESKALRDKLDALTNEQVKAYLENNSKYYSLEDGTGFFGRHKRDGMKILIIPRPQTNTDSDEEETEKSEKETSKNKKSTTKKGETK